MNLDVKHVCVCVCTNTLVQKRDRGSFVYQGKMSILGHFENFPTILKNVYYKAINIAENIQNEIENAYPTNHNHRHGDNKYHKQ